MTKNPPYLYNPFNGRVMIYTPDKHRVRPNLIPCHKLDASDILGDPNIIAARDQPVPEEQVVEPPKPKTTGIVGDSFDDIITQVEYSEDKAELKHIGAELGLTLHKAMKVSTMREKILEKIEEIRESI